MYICARVVGVVGSDVVRVSLVKQGYVDKQNYAEVIRIFFW